MCYVKIYKFVWGGFPNMSQKSVVLLYQLICMVLWGNLNRRSSLRKVATSYLGHPI